MWVLLAVVACAAAVLSFSALRDLATLCGLSTRLAWLLPVVIDAGAAAGCLIWLGEHDGGRRFSRSLTWLLLGSSVAGNAVVHGLTAYGLRPGWWLVVLVSAVAPAVLGAVVHLAVLVGRPASSPIGTGPSDDLADEVAAADGVPDLPAGLGRRRLAAELGVTEYAARQILAERNGVAR
jgi:hypothetical protein